MTAAFQVVDELEVVLPLPRHLFSVLGLRRVKAATRDGQLGEELGVLTAELTPPAFVQVEEVAKNRVCQCCRKHGRCIGWPEVEELRRFTQLQQTLFVHGLKSDTEPQREEEASDSAATTAGGWSSAASSASGPAPSWKIWIWSCTRGGRSLGPILFQARLPPTSLSAYAGSLGRLSVSNKCSPLTASVRETT